jgi:DNA-binding response OmpR family regulator
VNEIESTLSATRPRVLLVEDHRNLARMLSLTLRSFGYDVAIAPDLANANELARAEAFDVVVSDLTLPDGSGLELVRALQSRGQPVKAIALSGYGEADDIRRSIEAGFAEHLTKPLEGDDLHAAIQRVLHR